VKKGVTLFIVGLAMLIFDWTVQPVFGIQVTSGFRFPIGVLALVVGGLFAVSARMASLSAEISEGEISLWGTALEEATPRILELTEESLTTEYIVETVENETGIPEHVLVKYMYALNKHVQSVKESQRAEERRRLS
jgi:hypothetical protein